MLGISSVDKQKMMNNAAMIIVVDPFQQTTFKKKTLEKRNIFMSISEGQSKISRIVSI
jgi:hypothetical protein